MKKVIATENAPKALGPYSQGIVAGNLLFTAGQICIDPATGSFMNSSVEEEVNQIMKNLTAVAEAAGTALTHVVKTTIFVKDLNDYSTVNEVYGKYFEDNAPARSTVEVARLPADVRVEIDMVILIP